MEEFDCFALWYLSCTTLKDLKLRKNEKNLSGSFLVNWKYFLQM